VKRVLTAVVLIPLVILALFKAPLWLFAVLVFGVAVLATHEYLEMAKASGFRPFRTLSYLLLAWVFVTFSLSAGLEVTPLFLISLLMLLVPLVVFSFAFMVAAMRRDPLSQALADAAVSFLMLPYVAIPLVLIFVQRRTGGTGALFLLYLMIMVWAGDIAAFYFGRAFGKNKLAPRVSPGKTWEGAIASTAGSIIVGLLLFRYSLAIEHALFRSRLLDFTNDFFRDSSQTGPVFINFGAPTWLVILFALCINIAAQLGDLVESAFKRGAGLKDSGTLLPGHGGVLDRIDALLFAIPVGWLFYTGGMQFLFRIVRY